MAVEYVTQTLAEVPATGIDARVTQTLVEVLIKQPPETRVSQALAEVLVTQTLDTRVSQIYAEIIVGHLVIVTQVLAEVVISRATFSIIHRETRPVGYDFYPIVPRWDNESQVDQEPRINQGSNSEAMQQRSDDGPNAQLRRASLVYSGLAVGDKELLITFLRQHRGTKPFLWKCFPEDDDYTMWRGTSWTDKRDDKSSYSMTVALEELPSWFETEEIVTSITVVG